MKDIEKNILRVLKPKSDIELFKIIQKINLTKLKGRNFILIKNLVDKLIKHNQLDHLKKLIEQKLDIYFDEGEIFFRGILYENKDLLKYLIEEKKFDVRYGFHGKSCIALMWCINQQKLNILKYVLEYYKFSKTEKTKVLSLFKTGKKVNNYNALHKFIEKLAEDYKINPVNSNE